MSGGWFSKKGERPRGEVDWARQVRQDRERATQVMWGLLGVNVAVFVLWTQSHGTLLAGLMVQHFLVGVEAIVNFRLWTLITSAFSHQDANHLLFNMIGLYVFGGSVGQAVGYRGLLQLYLVGGVIASVGHVVYGVITGDFTPALGASGSVMALAVVYGALFPNRTLLIFFVLPMPAAMAVGGFILLDLFMAFSGGGSNVAHAAHLGGAAYGFAYWYLRLRRRPT